MKFYPEDKDMLEWAVYYADRNNIRPFVKYTSSFYTWEELPTDGVQVVVKYYRNADGSVRTERINGHEVYLENWASEEAIKSGKNVSKLVKFGTMLPDEQFHHMFDAILEDISHAD